MVIKIGFRITGSGCPHGAAFGRATADRSRQADPPSLPSSYLVPLSMAWIDERVVAATGADSVTARNIISRARAPLVLGQRSTGGCEQYRFTSPEAFFPAEVRTE